MIDHKKYKILGGGGLGDAAMLFAKLGKINSNFIELTHIEVPDTLLNIIKEFYDSQYIDSNVKKIPNWGWKKKNKNKFDLILDTSAYGVEDAKIGINPFPEFIIATDNKYNYDVVISPSSGRNGERNFDFNEISNFLSKYKNLKCVLLGKVNDPIIYNNLNVDNLLNITTIAESLAIIKSSNVVIAPSGFISIIGCMMKKNVFTKDNRVDIQKRYYHEDWNNKFITSLNEIKLC